MIKRLKKNEKMIKSFSMSLLSSTFPDRQGRWMGGTFLINKRESQIILRENGAYAGNVKTTMKIYKTVPEYLFLPQNHGYECIVRYST
jgi:hypothetical protein